MGGRDRLEMLLSTFTISLPPKKIRVTTATSDQREPAIYGDRIVWSDNRNNNNGDIYMGTISGLKTLVTNFSSNVTGGFAPLSVQFTDLSEKATGGTGTLEMEITHSTKIQRILIPQQGTYTVNLSATSKTAQQNYYEDSKLATITVLQPAVYAYVTSSFGVYVIDTTTNTVTTRIDAGNTHGVTVSQDGTKVYVTNFDSDGIVSVIDTSTNTVTARVKVGAFPEGVAVSPDGKNVYVANWRSGNMSVIDTSTNTIKATVDLGGNPCGVAVTPDGKKV